MPPSLVSLLNKSSRPTIVPPIIPTFVRILGQLTCVEVGLVTVREYDLCVAKRFVTGAKGVKAKADFAGAWRENAERKALWKGFALNLVKAGRNIVTNVNDNDDGVSFDL